jgi:hypothetical protein
MGGTVGEPGYRVTFNTSNVVMGGTSAPVFFEMIGENGSSGEALHNVLTGWRSRHACDFLNRQSYASMALWQEQRGLR